MIMAEGAVGPVPSGGLTLFSFRRGDGAVAPTGCVTMSASGGPCGIAAAPGGRTDNSARAGAGAVTAPGAAARFFCLESWR